MRGSWLVVTLASFLATPAWAAGPDAQPATTVRTETFSRGGSSEATYYIYEFDGRTICTKLAVCDKFDRCLTRYVAGAFKEEEDTGPSQPYGIKPPITIPVASLAKHVCLTRFGLAGRP